MVRVHKWEKRGKAIDNPDNAAQRERLVRDCAIHQTSNMELHNREGTHPGDPPADVPIFDFKHVQEFLVNVLGRGVTQDAAAVLPVCSVLPGHPRMVEYVAEEGEGRDLIIALASNVLFC